MCNNLQYFKPHDSMSVTIAVRLIEQSKICTQACIHANHRQGKGVIVRIAFKIATTAAMLVLQ